MRHDVDKTKTTAEERKSEEDLGNLVALRTEVYEEIQRRFALRGIKMIPRLEGLWGGVDLYTPRTLKIEGLDTGDTKIWTRLEPAHDSNQVASIFGESFGSKLRTSVGTGWGLDMVVESGSTSSKWYKFITPRSNNEAERHGQISWSGSLPAMKIVPQREWFPSSVQEIPAEALLTLFEAPQRDAFLLHLGRILAGPRGETTAEGILIEHFYRNLLAIKGPPGVGKSHLWDMLRHAISKLGYGAVPFDPKNEKFGMKQAVMADVSYCGDAASLDTILKLSDLKIYVTGGLHRLEEKNEKHEAVEIRAAFMFMLNDFHVSIQNMESGILDRLLLVETKPRNRLIGQRPAEVWPKLAQQAGVREEVLSLWLWRLGFEKFMDVVGYGVIAESWENRQPDRLEKETHRLKSTTTQIDLSHSRELATALVQFAAATAAIQRRVQHLLEAIKKNSVSISMLVTYLKFITSVKDYNDPLYQEAFRLLYPLHLDPDFVSLQGFMARFGDKVQEVEPGTLFKDLMLHLRTDRGFRYPTQWHSFREAYNAALLSFDDYYHHFQNLESDLMSDGKSLELIPGLKEYSQIFERLLLDMKQAPLK